jgi:AcrR family transcriptional regulator
LGTDTAPRTDTDPETDAAAKNGTAASFQRAHSEEQRAVRRRTILDTAAAMLAETPVGHVSLNELSRRVGLAKSNVLRYFESREDILLHLLVEASSEWVSALRQDLRSRQDADTPAAERAARAADTLVDSLAARPVLCDLIANQAAVLEHNVSPEIAARFKREAVGDARALTSLLLDYIPELGPDGAWEVAGTTILLAGAVWTHSRPSQAMLAAYAADPELAALRLDFATRMRGTLRTLLIGVLDGDASVR